MFHLGLPSPNMLVCDYAASDASLRAYSLTASGKERPVAFDTYLSLSAISGSLFRLSPGRDRPNASARSAPRAPNLSSSRISYNGGEVLKTFVSSFSETKYVQLDNTVSHTYTHFTALTHESLAILLISID